MRDQKIGIIKITKSLKIFAVGLLFLSLNLTSVTSAFAMDTIENQLRSAIKQAVASQQEMDRNAVESCVQWGLESGKVNEHGQTVVYSGFPIGLSESEYRTICINKKLINCGGWGERSPDDPYYKAGFRKFVSFGMFAETSYCHSLGLLTPWDVDPKYWLTVHQGICLTNWCGPTDANGNPTDNGGPLDANGFPTSTIDVSKLRAPADLKNGVWTLNLYKFNSMFVNEISRSDLRRTNKINFELNHLKSQNLNYVINFRAKGSKKSQTIESGTKKKNKPIELVLKSNQKKKGTYTITTTSKQKSKKVETFVFKVN